MNLYNLHGDSQVYEITDLIVACKDSWLWQRVWKLFWSRCERLGLRGEFFIPN